MLESITPIAVALLISTMLAAVFLLELSFSGFLLLVLLTTVKVTSRSLRSNVLSEERPFQTEVEVTVSDSLFQ
jgi:uncharacterized protein (DUF58 family)